MIKVIPIPAFDNNYIWLIKCEDTKHVTVIDPGDAQPVIAYLTKHQLQLSHILVTHHHYDHIDGISTLKAHYNDVTVYGPEGIKNHLVTDELNDQERIFLPDLNIHFNIMHVPGHTLDHIAYYAEEHNLLFCGDVLFSCGCGRMFEGTPSMFWQTLLKLRNLPPLTQVYCTHEYTLDNIRFAEYITPNNQALAQYKKRVHTLRQAHQPSLPSTMQQECLINPFLNADDVALQQRLTQQGHLKTLTAVDTFATLRKLKDNF